jgi:HEAT repeat protein
MRLGRPPKFGLLRSWGLWHLVYPGVRTLTLKRDVEGLLSRLDVVENPPEDDKFGERASIAFALGRLQADAAVPRLATLLGLDEPLSVRVSAAGALQRIGGPSAADALVPALNDESWEVQKAAIRILETTPRSAAYPTLAALVTGESHPLVRGDAAGALGRAKEDTWIPLLESAASDQSLLVALGAADGLLQTESPAALEALRNITRHGRGLLRRLLMRWTARKLRRKLRRNAGDVRTSVR